jgi:hypothetical protein
MSYDELMLGCLQVCSFEKSAAIQLFINQHPDKASWITPYAYKVYNRVMKEMKPEMEVLVNETVMNLRRASEATLQRGMDVGDWAPFNQVTNTILKASGLQNTNNTINIGNHAHITTSDDVRNRINELQTKLGIGNLGISTNAGGVQQTPHGISVIDIPSTPQTANHPKLTS